MNQKVDLVSKDYYDQEIKYQERIDATNNLNSLKTRITITASRDELCVSFPENFLSEKVKGKITIYRPSNSSLDNSYNLSLDEKGVQKITSLQLKKGLYKAQLDFSIGTKKYFQEESLFIN